MFERLHSMMIKEFLQVFRDPRMRSTIIIAPVFQLLIFGFAATTDINHVATAVYDRDNSAQSRRLIQAFTQSGYFSAKYYINDDNTQKDLIDKSQVNAVIRINHGFASDIESGKNPQVQLIVDGTDSNTAAVVLGYASRIAQSYSKEILQDKAGIVLQAQNIPQIQAQSRVWFNDDLRSRDFYIPGVVALIVTIITLLLTSLSIVREKEMGTIEQLVVSPIKPFELILGKFSPFIIIALFDVIFVTAMGVWIFQVPVRGNILLLLFASAVYLMTSLGIGLFISTISSTQQEAVMSTFMFFLPANMFSGFIFPIANMPVIIQYLTYLNPLRYFLVILRGIFLKGSGIDILWPQILILFIIGITILTISSLRFHKRLG